MAIAFYKFHGTGNDFIIIDDRKEEVFQAGNVYTDLIASLCNRHFGIGADGLILIRKSETHDFKMVYFNADGKEGTMCGNGGRCVVAFAKMKQIIENSTIFEAIDGIHRARVLASDNNQYVVSLQLGDVAPPRQLGDYLTINTGSPHLIVFTEDLHTMNVMLEGHHYRNAEEFAKDGINVNFVKVKGKETLFVRTYERGVEAETLSCGTGVTAAAIGAWVNQIRNVGNMYTLLTQGGSLKVSFSPPKADGDNFTDVWLTGPASFVFTGEIQV